MYLFTHWLIYLINIYSYPISFIYISFTFYLYIIHIFIYFFIWHFAWFAGEMKQESEVHCSNVFPSKFKFDANFIVISSRIWWSDHNKILHMEW